MSSKRPAPRQIALGEVCVLRAGAAFKPALQGRPAGDFPFIKVSDFNTAQNAIRIYGANNWVDAGDKGAIAGEPFHEGTSVFAKIGEALKHNRVRFLTRPTYIDNNLMGAAPRRELIDPSYLFQFLRTVDFAATNAGTAVPYLTAGNLSRIPVPLPALDVQSRIASILGAYDDLIEVNQRRIAVLEEMARRLFEEWFVHFRFPGHSPTAGKPDEWPTGTAADLIDFDPPTPLPRATSKPFIPMTHLSTGTSLIDSPEWREAGSGAKFRNDDTLFARITPCLENGKTGLVRDLPGDGVGFGSTEYIVMRGRVAGPAFTYLLARHDAFRSHARRSMSGASGRQRARTESVRGFAMAVPPASLLATFDAHAWPMLRLVGQLGESNKRLAASRDLLLPRLISGDLSVAAAERELEAVA